jgi:hypothetical protein
MGFSAPLLRCVVILLKSELVSKEMPFGKKKVLKEKDHCNNNNNNKKHC